MVDSVHKNGANIIAQLAVSKDLDMSVEEIHRITDLFADAAENVKEQDLMELK